MRYRRPRRRSIWEAREEPWPLVLPEDPVPPLTHLWHMWPGRNWPATADEEAQFVSDLRAKSRSKSPAAHTFDRGDVIALVDALRCGVVCDDLLARAPGLDAGRLLAAWDHLDTARADASRAWNVMAQAGTADAYRDLGRLAARLLPVPVGRIEPLADVLSPDRFAAQMLREHTQVEAVTAQTEIVEEALATRVPPDEEGVTLGRALYDPFQPALWGDPHFLASRVGQLSPLRVADLLGERHLDGWHTSGTRAGRRGIWQSHTGTP